MAERLHPSRFRGDGVLTLPMVVLRRFRWPIGVHSIADYSAWLGFAVQDGPSQFYHETKGFLHAFGLIPTLAAGWQSAAPRRERSRRLRFESLKDRRLLAQTTGLFRNNMAEACSGFTLFNPLTVNETYLINVDLLTVLLHEIHHLSGDLHEDLGVMPAALPVGTRRLTKS